MQPDFLTDRHSPPAVALTDETRGILNADLFARLPRGASPRQCRAWPHLVEADFAALDSSVLSGAVRDATELEPPQRRAIRSGAIRAFW